MSTIAVIKIKEPKVRKSWHGLNPVTRVDPKNRYKNKKKLRQQWKQRLNQNGE